MLSFARSALLAPNKILPNNIKTLIMQCNLFH